MALYKIIYLIIKKFIFTIVCLVLLSGCSQINKAPSPENISTYNNDEFNISFDYPSNWEVMDKQIVKALVDDEVIDKEEEKSGLEEILNSLNFE